MTPIAITIDDNYIQHACVMLQSLSAHTRTNLTVYCIYDTISPEKQAVLQKHFHGKNLNLIFIKFDRSLLPQLPIKKNDHVSSAAFFRIWLPQILGNLKQVLFLDTDLVINGSIDELLLLDIPQYALAAVIDPGTGSPKKQLLGMDENAGYFNSGVMVLNLEYMRQNQITAKLSAFVTEKPHLCEFWDQDAFNGVINGNFYHLSAAYNMQSNFYDNSEDHTALQQAIQNPVIVHYTGGGYCKPWFYHNTHPLKSLYYQYLKKTPFKFYYPPDLPRSWHIFRKLKFMLFK